MRWIFAESHRSVRLVAAVSICAAVCVCAIVGLASVARPARGIPSERATCVAATPIQPIVTPPVQPVPTPPPPLMASSELRAVFETSLGTITCSLDAVHAPHIVANFVALARGQVAGATRSGPFYDGLTFHRVIPGFVIQGGDPLGNGTGGPGYVIADEMSPSLHFDGPGVLAMANRGKDTNGSQFFITDAAQPHLDGGSTIFGRCGDPDVIHAIASVPRSWSDRPTEPVTIDHVIILNAQ